MGIRAYEGQYDAFPPAALWSTPGVILSDTGLLFPGTVDLVGNNATNWRNDRFMVGFHVLTLDFLAPGSPNPWNVDVPISAPQNHTIRSLVVQTFICPSDYSGESATKSKLMGGNWARGNYAVNAGPDPLCLVEKLPSIGPFPMPDLSCRTLYPDIHDLRGVELNPNSLWGVFQVSSSGVAGINRVFASRHITDGLSRTIMLEEIVAGVDAKDRRGCWAMPGVGSSITFGHGYWNKGGTPNSPRALDIIQDGDASFNPPSDGSYHASLTASPRSRHPGGIHVLFVDGIVEFISDKIDPHVWTSLHTRASGDTADPIRQ